MTCWKTVVACNQGKYSPHFQASPNINSYCWHCFLPDTVEWSEIFQTLHGGNLFWGLLVGTCCNDYQWRLLEVTEKHGGKKKELHFHILNVSGLSIDNVLCKVFEIVSQYLCVHASLKLQSTFFCVCLFHVIHSTLYKIVDFPFNWNAINVKLLDKNIAPCQACFLSAKYILWLNWLLLHCSLNLHTHTHTHTHTRTHTHTHTHTHTLPLSLSLSHTLTLTEQAHTEAHACTPMHLFWFLVCQNSPMHAHMHLSWFWVCQNSSMHTHTCAWINAHRPPCIVKVSDCDT